MYIASQRYSIRLVRKFPISVPFRYTISGNMLIAENYTRRWWWWWWRWRIRRRW